MDGSSVGNAADDGREESRDGALLRFVGNVGITRDRRTMPNRNADWIINVSILPINESIEK
jgi:hypothetical protein